MNKEGVKPGRRIWMRNQEATISRCNWRICTGLWKREAAVSSEIIWKIPPPGRGKGWGILGILNNFSKNLPLPKFFGRGGHSWKLFDNFFFACGAYIYKKRIKICACGAPNYLCMLFLHLFTSSAGLGILTYHTHWSSPLKGLYLSRA